MKPRRITALFILFVAIFAFWWGISVLSQQELQQQTQPAPRHMTLTLLVGSSTASTTPQQIQISFIASSTPTIEGVLINGAQASTTVELQ